MSTSKRLDGRVAVVTAAGSGIGRASAVAFAQEGAVVVASDRDGQAAAETASMIERAGGAAQPNTCDVAEVDQLRELFALVEREHGKLHVLFNNAGIPGTGDWDAPEAEWQRAIDINLKSAYYATALALPLLSQAAGHASIIYTASIAGLVGTPRSPLYSMTKGGVVLFMRGVALRHARDGIRANAICPGPVQTPMLSQFFDRAPGTQSAESALAEVLAQAVPMGRPGAPEEVARAALFLACDDSSFVTGAALPVDGGYTAQ